MLSKRDTVANKREAKTAQQEDRLCCWLQKTKEGSEACGIVILWEHDRKRSRGTRIFFLSTHRSPLTMAQLLSYK